MAGEVAALQALAQVARADAFGAAGHRKSRMGERIALARLAHQQGTARIGEQGLGVRRKSRSEKVKRASSEEHTSELQSLMRISYAVFCLKHKSCLVQL